MFFYNLVELNLLNLNNNPIKRIENNAFNGLTNLKILNISDLVNLEFISNISFNSLYKIEDLFIQRNNLTRLETNIFKEMKSLTYLYLDGNKISKLDKDWFIELNNLTNLTISSNQLKSIQNETFIYLITLINLTLHDNQIEFIDLNGFKGLLNLTYLNLNANKIKDLQVNNHSIFSNLPNLVELHLQSNLIISIKSGDLNILTKLEILNIKSNGIQVIEPSSLDYFGSNIKRLLITMPNISNENIYSIKNSLKAKTVRKYLHWKYYSATYVENRNDSFKVCVKQLFLMKSKILYNFLNEHIDIQTFLSNCMNLTQLRNDLNYFENSSLHQIEENYFQFYLRDYLQKSSTPMIVLYISIGLFTIFLVALMIFKDIVKNKKNKIQIQQQQALLLQQKQHELQQFQNALNNTNFV